MLKVTYRTSKKLTLDQEDGAWLYGKGRRVLMRLAPGAKAEARLLEVLSTAWQSPEEALEKAGLDDFNLQARGHFLIHQALGAGLLDACYAWGERPLLYAFPAIKTPLPAWNGKGLSRFAWARPEKTGLRLASPLSSFVVSTAEPGLTGLVSALAGKNPAEPPKVQGFSEEEIDLVLKVLTGAGLLALLDDAEDKPPLAWWQWHDLMFHSRSLWRLSDYDPPDTLRFKDVFPCPRVVKTKSGRPCLELPPVDENCLALLDRPFGKVLSDRRTRRRPAKEPVGLGCLSALLHSAARLKSSKELEQEGVVSFRPYPSAGARHPLELYLAANKVNGLEPGLYHYQPQKHSLSPLAGNHQGMEDLLAFNPLAPWDYDPPQAQIWISARFGRTAWKYESVAYRLVQMDLGCLYQTLYLVATALELKPCCLGAAEVDLFARATGLDALEEPAVGLFVVSK